MRPRVALGNEAGRSPGRSEPIHQVDPIHLNGCVTVTLDGSKPDYEIFANSAYDFIALDAPPAAEPGVIRHISPSSQNSVSEAALGRLKSQAKAEVFVDVNP